MRNIVICFCIIVLLMILMLVILFMLKQHKAKKEAKKAKCVSVITKGRLGNHFFEIISSWAYAKKYNINFVLSRDYLKNYKKYYDKYFNGIKLEDVNDGSFEKKTYSCYDNISDIKPIAYKDCILIDSFLQNSKNFNRYRDEILKTFFNINSIKPVNNKFFIHIRLTDFKTSNNHNLDLSNYYKKAISYLQTQVDFNKIVMYVVSDDIVEARKQNYLNMFPSQSLVFVDNNEYDEIKTLELFKECCGGAIIGHSTFAWWGAYIINCPSKIVVCPNKFLKADEDYSGLYLNYKVIDV